MQQIKQKFQDWQGEYREKKNFESEQRTIDYFGTERTVYVMINTEELKEWTRNSAELLNKLLQEIADEKDGDSSDIKHSIQYEKDKMSQFDQIIELFLEFSKRIDDLQEKHKDLLQMKQGFWGQVLSQEQDLIRTALDETYFNQEYLLNSYTLFDDAWCDKDYNDEVIESFKAMMDHFDQLEILLKDKKEAGIIKIAMASYKRYLEGKGLKEAEMKENEEETLVLDISEDMYCGSMSSDIIGEYVCMICYGIVQEPIKCKTCNMHVCKGCVNLNKVKNGTQMCFKKCGSYQFNLSLTGVEKCIYDSLLFRCQNDECVERIPLRNYRSHMQHKCKVRTWKYVQLPKGACISYNENEYGDYGDENGEEEEDDWVFDPNEEIQNPYYEKFLVGDLNRLYLEEGEELDEEIEQWNEKAHEDYEQKYKKREPRHRHRHHEEEEEE